MDQEIPEEITLNRNDSIFMRRFDPEYMMPLDLSRSVSMNQNHHTGTNMDKLANMDYGGFINGQQEWKRDSSNLKPHVSSNEMMMEELPQSDHKLPTDDFLDLSLPLEKRFSFLGGEDRENINLIDNNAYTNELLGILNHYSSQANEGTLLQNYEQKTHPLQIHPVKPPKQAQDEIFSHNGERGGRVPAWVSVTRPSCNCNKSQCLKLYCLCFREGYSCHDKCRCLQCLNTDKNKSQVNILRNQKQLRHGNHEADDTYCNCRMSFCEKSYCACAKKGRPCSSLCRCFHCKNPHGAKCGKNQE